MESKMDIVVERSLKTEQVALANKGTIRIILASLLAGISAVGTYIARTFLGN
jgi:hypothetical protein